MRGAKLFIGIVGWVIGIAGCKTNDTSTTLQLVRAMTADANCTYTVENATIYSGQFDMTAAADGYHLALEVRNLSAAETEDPQTGFGAYNTRPRTNDILIDTYDVCWYRYNKPLPTSTEAGYVTCDDLAAVSPSQVTVINGAVTVERQGRAVSELQLLTLPHLRALYGDAFTPAAIPIQGNVANLIFSTGSQSPALTNRNAAWGTYPDTQFDKVIVQMRANGTMQGDIDVISNWFRFEINLCARCIVRCPDMSIQTCAADMCTLADASKVACPNPCGGTDICIDGLCGDGTPCGTQLCPTANGQQAMCLPVRQQFYSAFPVPSLTDTCLPSQGDSEITCTVGDVCASPYDGT